MRTAWWALVGLAACTEAPSGIQEVPIGEPAQATIGAAGGTLASADGRLVLDIPAGALGADTAIEIQRIEWEGGGAWSLRPDGLAFASPITATITLSESEVGSPTTEIVDGEPTLDLPAPSFGHFSFASDTADETLSVEVTWREADAELDYALALAHFSTVTYVQTAAGRSTNRARAGLGETFRVGSYARPGTQRVSIVTICGTTWGRHEVEAELGVTSLQVSDYGIIHPTTGPFEANVGTEGGYHQYFECASLGLDAFTVTSRTRLFNVTALPAGCRNMEPQNEIRRERTIECVDECPFPDPVDASISADGDPSIDLRCARTGAFLTNGRPWARAVFEGPWPPSSEYYSWFKRFTFMTEAGPVGSYVHQRHDGVEEEIFDGGLTMGNTRILREPTGCTVEIPTTLGTITSVRIESGILKTPDGTFVMDQIDVSPFDLTPRQP